MLRVRHIPGNEIAQRPGSTRACQQESQNTPGQTNSNPHYDAKLRIKGPISEFNCLFYQTVALVKLPFGMLRCAVAATVNRQ
jgi:hypothetical protein